MFRFSAILKTASKCSRFPRKSVSWRLQSFKKWTTMPRPGPGWGAPGTGQDLGPLVPCAKLPPPPPKICSGGRHHQIDGSGGRGRCCFQMLRTGSTLAWEPEAHPWRSQVGSGLKNPKVLYLGVFRQTQTKNSPTRKHLEQFYVLKQNRWAIKLAEKTHSL